MAYCWSSRDQKGDIIQFVKDNITGGDFRKAVEYLIGGTGFQYVKPEKKESMNIKRGQVEINYADNMKRAFAYLCKTRGINPAIVKELIDKKLINEDDRHNLVLKYLDKSGATVGAEVIGTNSTIRYKSVVKNSNEKYGFSLCLGNKVSTVIVFEASLDLLSYYQMNEDKLNNSLLLSLGGAEKINKIATYLILYEGVDTIIVCTDNDCAGNIAYDKIAKEYGNYNILDGREALRESGVKDFNELLIKKK